jgi:oligopeptide transport system permease protein
MVKFILKRIGYMIITLWVISTATFFLMNCLPGDPLDAQTKKLPAQVKAAIRKKWNLDKSVPERYLIFLRNLTKLELGESIDTPGLTVNQVITRKFPNSARLGLQAEFFGLAVGVFLGITAAYKRNTWVDYIVMVVAIIGISVPGFVVAALLQKVFGGKILPIVGWPIRHIWTTGFKYTVLPTIALSFGSIAQYARYSKASVLDVINQDYVLTARAKGASGIAITFKHVLRNAMIPIVTILGPATAGIITGSFVIERIFSIPGLGAQLINSIGRRDYMMIMGMTIFLSFLYIASLLVVDITYGLIDPRIRVSGEKR